MFTGPTKMCIKSAPYLHYKRANWAINMLLFYALHWCECFDAKLAQNLMQICSK